MNEAAQLIAELAQTGARSICISAQTSSHAPGLAAAAAGLGLRVTTAPVGDEDIVACLCDRPDAGLEAALSAVQAPPPGPFLLLIAAPDTGADLSATIDAVLAGSNQWLVRADLASAGRAAVLAPAARLLAAETMPGQWRAAAESQRPPAPDPDPVPELWQAAERDLGALWAIGDRLDRSAQRLDDARRARERMSAEVARMREAERHELDRMRLALLEQRAWVADQARRLGASRSWRMGHRMVRVGRLLVLKRDRGTDLPAMIARRMEDGDSK